MNFLFKFKRFLLVILYEIKHFFLFINTVVKYKKLNLSWKLIYLDFKINYIYNSHRNYDNLKLLLNNFFFQSN